MNWDGKDSPFGDLNSGGYQNRFPTWGDKEGEVGFPNPDKHYVTTAKIESLKGLVEKRVEKGDLVNETALWFTEEKGERFFWICPNSEFDKVKMVYRLCLSMAARESGTEKILILSGFPSAPLHWYEGYIKYMSHLGFSFYSDTPELIGKERVLTRGEKSNGINISDIRFATLKEARYGSLFNRTLQAEEGTYKPWDMVVVDSSGLPSLSYLDKKCTLYIVPSLSTLSAAVLELGSNPASQSQSQVEQNMTQPTRRTYDAGENNVGVSSNSYAPNSKGLTLDFAISKIKECIEKKAVFRTGRWVKIGVRNPFTLEWVGDGKVGISAPETQSQPTPLEIQKLLLGPDYKYKGGEEPFGLPQGRRDQSYYYPVWKFLLEELSLAKEAPKNEVPKEEIPSFPKQDQLDSLRRAKETLEKIHTSLPAEAQAQLENLEKEASEWNAEHRAKARLKAARSCQEGDIYKSYKEACEQFSNLAEEIKELVNSYQNYAEVISGLSEGNDEDRARLSNYMHNLAKMKDMLGKLQISQWVD